MRYGYVGYTQVLDGDRLSLEKIIKRKKPDPETKLSKQIKRLMKTAIFQTTESLYRMSKMPTGIVKMVPARPKGVVNSPNFLATRLSDVFYTNSADFLLKTFSDLDMEQLAALGHTMRKYGVYWQPIYDLLSDDPTVHIKLLKKLLKAMGYEPADNYSTVFCFGLVNIGKYKELVAACPRLLRPYLCLIPNSMKQHEAALKWATKRTGIRVALNVPLFVEKKDTKPLKKAYQDIKVTWEHNFAGRFVPLCMLSMEHLNLLPMLTKKSNVIITDFNPLDGTQYKISKPKPKPAPLPVEPPKKVKKPK